MTQIRLYITSFQYLSPRLFEIFQYSESGKVEISEIARDKFALADRVEDADWVLIPVFITELVSQKGRKLIRNASEIAKRVDKPFGVFSNSDFIVDLEVDNAYLFTPGSYRSKPYQIDLPATLPEDPYLKWFGPNWTPIPYTVKPSVGFCGQATTQPLKAIKDLYTFGSTKFKNWLGLTLSNPGPIFLPAFQRAILLKYFEKDSRFEADFILRNKYKGGAKTKAQKSQVESDFYKNIHNNLFTVCLRGMGNYSVRFFQTLAMGRIPILIDTDCNITYQEYHQLDQLIPVVPYNKRNEVNEIVYEYFISKTPDELEVIQSKCRQIWMEYFRKKSLINLTYHIMLEKSPRK